MASADSKFDDLSDADIDSLVEKAVPEMTKKATLANLTWGVLDFYSISLKWRRMLLQR